MEEILQRIAEIDAELAQYPDEIDDPVAALAVIEKELARRAYLEDPVKWVEEILHDNLWHMQKEILQAVATHRRVAVKSCHEVGKSFVVSDLTGWWISTSPPGDAFVVTSAPSASQVRSILWKEIGRVHTRGNLAGRTNQTEWLMTVPGGKEEQVAFGRKPDEFNPTAFQGIHAPKVLVIFDEANGIRGPLWEAADSLIANDESKMVAIGNPDDPTGEFFEACKPGSGWHVIEISAFMSPNFTGEKMPLPVLKQLIGRTYVEEKRRKWAPLWHWVDKNGQQCEPKDGIAVIPPPDVDPTDTHPYWQSKILGRFPEKSLIGGLIQISWVVAAQMRALKPGLPVELGVDVGGGGDPNAVCVRRGSVYRIRRVDNDADTMSQTGKVINDLEETGATVAKVDKNGIGWGVVDRGREQGKPFVGINVGEGPSEDDEANDERFLNLKAELYWNVRSLFEANAIDIDENDEELASELLSVRYERTSKGKIKIADKRKDASGKPIPSPNRAEALMLAAAPVPVEAEDWVTW